MCSANRGDSLDRSIDEENQKMKDFLILVSYQNYDSYVEYSFIVIASSMDKM